MNFNIFFRVRKTHCTFTHKNLSSCVWVCVQIFAVKNITCNLITNAFFFVREKSHIIVGHVMRCCKLSHDIENTERNITAGN